MRLFESLSAPEHDLRADDDFQQQPGNEEDQVDWELDNVPDEFE